MTTDNRKDLGRIIKRQRALSGLTLQKLSAASGVSMSHLGRIERGERYPSAGILQKIAKPLGFDEAELLTLADYLSPQPSAIKEEKQSLGQLDPYVARLLASEPVEVQRAVIGILAILKSIAKSSAE